MPPNHQATKPSTMRFAASHLVYKLLSIILLALVLFACSKSSDPITVDFREDKGGSNDTTNTSNDSTTTTLVDYMPLSVGNQWSYSFHNFFRTPGGQIIDTIRGTSQWKIISLTTSNEDSIYLVEETVNAVSIHAYNFVDSSGVDTSYFVDAQFHFTITQSPNHRILFQFGRTSSSPNNYLTYVFQWREVYRYGDPAILGDVILYGPNDYFLTVL